MLYALPPLSIIIALIIHYFSQRLDLPLYERLKLLVDTLGEPGTNVSELKVQEEALSQLANVSFSLIRFFIWGGRTKDTVITSLKQLILDDNMILVTALSNISSVPIPGMSPLSFRGRFIVNIYATTGKGDQGMIDWGHRMAEALVILFEAHNKIIPLVVHQVGLEQNQTSPLGLYPPPLQRMTLPYLTLSLSFQNPSTECRSKCLVLIADTFVDNILPMSLSLI